MAMTAAARVVQCRQCGRRNRVPAAADGTPRCGTCHAWLPWIADAGDDDFADVVEHASIPVLVDFWASWCGPCRKVSPELEKVAGDLAGRIKLVKVDVDRSPRLTERFTVQAVPTLLVMRTDQVIARQAGAAPAPALRRWIDQALAGAGGGPS